MGRVYLVGAGPGDPGLITQRGAELLHQAQCLIYDRLVDPALLQLTSRKCERIYVGKEELNGTWCRFSKLRGTRYRFQQQSAINRLLVQKARQHRKVVRLKGGDPTLFGRITEEMDALSKAGIPFEVVPGVSSAWAAAALAGIPLTDRKLSSSIAIVTGQEAQGKRSKLNWARLARAVDTIVILMSRAALPEIAQRLIEGGRPSSTPVALIRWAATSQQQILISTLGTVEPDLKSRPPFGPPVVAVVGKVVELSQKFKPAPLKGKRILVTRPAEEGGDLTQRLESLGATCVHLPTIAIYPRKIKRQQMNSILKKLPRYDWILFTSRHGVEALEGLAQRLKKRLPKLIRGKICAIGPRTREALEASGLRAALVPEIFSTEGIRQAFKEILIRGKKILIPRSNLAVRDELSRFLRQRGAVVEELVMYETAWVKQPPQRLKTALKNLDAATFTSASTVRGFLASLAGAKLEVQRALNGAQVVAIGPATAQALRESGIRRFHLPKGAWTVEGLIEAVKEAVGS